MAFKDTIAAVATPPGVGGIAVIRISGPQAKAIIKKLTRLKQFKPNRISPAQLYTLNEKQKLDQVLISTFAAPHSYTGEDVIEINCHGSIYLTNKILEECLKAGARLAEPGEFTKRAYLAGKIDLTQVEAVSEMIAAKTDISAQLALKHLEGDVSKKIKQMRLELLAIQAEIEASLDFPEEIAEPEKKQLKKKLNGFLQEVQLLLSNSNKGILLNQGINIVLAGKTNVGKSSLFNLLARENRAIVTEIHGTTRDYLEAEVAIQGIKVTLIDTAGIRHSNDQVEKIGIARSKEYISSAEIVLFILDTETGFTEEDNAIAETFKQNKNVIYVLNKIDRNPQYAYPGAIKISAYTGKGIKALEKKIIALMELNRLDLNKNIYVSSLRQKEKLLQAKEILTKAMATLSKADILDLLAIDIKEIITILGEITGDEVSEEVIAHIFDNFCVGK